MATRRTQAPPPESDLPEHIVDIDVQKEMQDSFLEYAYSVIYSRALPDARDGLKPVQRRIMFAMHEMNLRPDRPHVKCTRVIGDVMGKYHPHGDAAIYDALVRMAQPWALRLPLVDGHGNFGSLDNGPAAARYTECRLAPAALAMTSSLDEDVVDFVPNYDGSEMQPEVLPSAIPNLLVNGASGIAVGMATNMVPHNLGEVISAARHLIKHPNATLETLMKHVPGPDLPSGGRIIGLDGIRDAYATGRGSFKTRATTKIENVTSRKKAIVVTELPYMVGAEKVIAKIKEAVQAKKLQGVSDVIDLTDRHHGLRLVIEIKTGFNPDAVLTQLYRQTPMEDSFGINNVCLVNGQPQTLGLKELLQVYLDHRISVVRRRTQFRLTKAQDRLHLVDGLLTAIVDIDEVISVIRTSDDSETARTRLMQVFDLSQAQAEYILELRLRRLTRFSRLELEKEQAELRAQITELQSILNDEEKLRTLVSDELAEVAREHGTPRRTVLLEGSNTPVTTAAPLEITDDPCFVLLSGSGLVARTSTAEPLPRFTEKDSRRMHDVIVSRVEATARGEVAVVTNRGRMIRLGVVDLPTLPPSATAPTLAGGAPLKEFTELGKGEKVLGLCSLSEEGGGLALGTAQGVVKRVSTDYPKGDEWEAISLKPGDEVVGAVELSPTGRMSGDDAHLVFITSDAQLLHYPASLVRPQGRSAGGMAGIRLGKDAKAVFFGAVSSQDLSTDGVAVTVTASDGSLPGMGSGTVKVAPLAGFPAKGRGTGGVRCHRLGRGESALATGWVGTGPAMAGTAGGRAIPLPPATGRRDGSGSPLEQTVAVISGPIIDDVPAESTPEDGQVVAEAPGEGATP